MGQSEAVFRLTAFYPPDPPSSADPIMIMLSGTWMLISSWITQI